MILIAEQKNGAIQYNELLQQLMNNLIVDLRSTNNEDYTAISKDLKVRWQADSSGNWETAQAFLNEAAALATSAGGVLSVR